MARKAKIAAQAVTGSSESAVGIGKPHTLFQHAVASVCDGPTNWRVGPCVDSRHRGAMAELS